VSIVGHLNVPSRLAADASALYARNLLNLLNLIIDKEKKELAINWDDEIVKGVALTKDGDIIHPQFAKAKEEKAETPEKEVAEKKPKKAKKEAEAKTDESEAADPKEKNA